MELSKEVAPDGQPARLEAQHFPLLLSSKPDGQVEVGVLTQEEQVAPALQYCDPPPPQQAAPHSN